MSFWRRTTTKHSVRAEDMSAEERRSAVRECELRLHIISALARAMEDPSRVFALLVAADDIGEARAFVEEHFNVDEIQATAILDLQWRRAPRAEREKIQTEHQELVQNLRELRAGPR